MVIVSSDSIVRCTGAASQQGAEPESCEGCRRSWVVALDGRKTAQPATLICHVLDLISQVLVLRAWQRLAADCWQELKLMQDEDNELRELGPDHAGAGAVRCETD